jgi:hypothetical protein
VVYDAATNTPIAGARVRVVAWSAPAESFSPPPPVITDVRGFFCTPSLPPDKYGLDVDRPGYRRKQTPPYPLSPDGTRVYLPLLPSQLVVEEAVGVAGKRP